MKLLIPANWLDIPALGGVLRQAMEQGNPLRVVFCSATEARHPLVILNGAHGIETSYVETEDLPKTIQPGDVAVFDAMVSQRAGCYGPAFVLSGIEEPEIRGR